MYQLGNQGKTLIVQAVKPIALTSQMGKTMEKMVNDRLAYWVESKGWFQWYQSGFRRGRGTMDPVVCLEDAVRKAQVNKETVVAVFFDIEKAYDMMWTEGLLIKLNKMGVRGRIYQWISAFLSERTLRVRIDGELSESFRAENCTPQGSIVSPLFFAIITRYLKICKSQMESRYWQMTAQCGRRGGTLSLL